LNSFLLFSQQKPVGQLTRDDIMAMSFDDLSTYPLEEQMKMAGIAGVSYEELFKMLLNKDVSIASKRDESLFDTPLSTSVLTAEDIARSGVLSVPEAMRLVPGVIVREKTNGNYDVQLRSSNNIADQQSLFSENTMTLVMLDGRIVHTHTTGGMFWETLPVSISEVERIEVIRGAASAMYGANAVNGVINIITKKTAPDKVSVEANINTGSYFNASGTHALRGVSTQYLSTLFNVNDKLKLKASANYNYRERRQSGIYFYMTDDLQREIGRWQFLAKYYPVDSVIIHGANPKEMFQNPNTGLQTYGANGMASYTVNEHLDFLLTTGIQQSQVISSNLDLYFFVHNERDMQTQYVNLHSKIYGFNIQSNYTWGNGNLARGIPGLQADWNSFNINAEYNYQWNKLTVNPGFTYSANMLNSSAYKAENQSYFNGVQKLNSWAPNLRLDYKPTENLRFIGGIRLEKNEVPDKFYLTWQLAGNYKTTGNSIVRAVYSRANRSPFMMDVNTNSSVAIFSDRDRTQTTTVMMEGNKHLRLAVVDMYELGYRQKIGNHLLLNLEVFHSVLNDLNTSNLIDMRIRASLPLNKIPLPYYLHYQFRNLPEVQKQTGATLELGLVVSNSLNFRFWGTWQQMNLKNHINNSGRDVNSDSYVPTMVGMAYVVGDTYRQAYQDALNLGNSEENAKIAGAMAVYANYSHNGSTTDFKVDENDMHMDYLDVKSRSTPAFYGGGEMNWQISQKISFFANVYGFSQHDFSNQFLTTQIKSKLLLNGKISYHFTETAALSFAVNNILNDSSPEFGFMDKVGTQWYLGFSFKL
jgi:iron complex outermembrane receptor protein